MHCLFAEKQRNHMGMYDVCLQVARKYAYMQAFYMKNKTEKLPTSMPMGKEECCPWAAHWKFAMEISCPELEMW